MGSEVEVIIVGTLLTVVGGQLLVRRYAHRSARQVATDLLAADEEQIGSAQTRPVAKSVRGESQKEQYDFSKTGWSKQSQHQFLYRRRVMLVGGLVAGALVWWVMGKGRIPLLPLFSFAGYFVAYVIGARQFASACERYTRDLEFFLPIVMERLVMAVHAGLDVIAAVRTVLEHERESGVPLSPVSELLHQVLKFTESGLPFEQALQQVSSMVPSPPVRHAFLHLGMAYKEGGELVMPLRELSDATQLYFQESIEESIAKMPVKATVPLVITFAGLILIFMALPLVQVLTMMQRSMPGQ